MNESRLFSINELVQLVQESMADWPVPENGQISPVPDVRTLRYYGQLGLLDKPAAFRGRTGLYANRHLLQVLAIKHLQYQGKSLDEIQQMILGLDSDALQSLLKDVTTLPEIKNSENNNVRKREAFWAQENKSTVHSALMSTQVVQIELPAGATLTLPASHLSEEAFEELPAALDSLQLWLETYLQSSSTNNQGESNDSH